MQINVVEQERASKLQEFEIYAESQLFSSAWSHKWRERESRFVVYEAFYEYDL